MNADTTQIRKSLGRTEVRSMSKLVLTAVTLLFVVYLATVLPGIDRIIPQTPVAFAAVVSAIATIAVVGLLFYMAPKAASLVRLTVTGPKSVVENMASVVHWVVILAAILVAHSGLAGVLTPFFDGFVWLYDTVFLLLALPILAIIAARLYVSLDPGADLIADVVVGPANDESSRDSASKTSGDRTTSTGNSPAGEQTGGHSSGSEYTNDTSQESGEIR